MKSLQEQLAEVEAKRQLLLDKIAHEEGRKGSIAAEITKARMRAGITKRELARRLMIDEAAICRIEAAKNSPRISTLKRIARALDMELVVEFRQSDSK